MLGGLKRSTGATAMNASSSRSHAIFTVTVQRQSKINDKECVTAKFHLVDLAGSERPKKTMATGERFKEGVKINQGLLALGNVISALGDDNQSFISYRDSKLTRLLQDSLGGNSITLMIACVSPAGYNIDETISTLRYADRAKKIKNKPIVNTDPNNAEMSKLKHRIKQLELELQMQGSGGVYASGGDNEEIGRLRIENTRLRQQNKQLLNQLEYALTENANMMERSLISETAREKMQNLVSELKSDWEESYTKIQENPKEMEKISQKIQELHQAQDILLNDVMDYDVLTTSNKPPMNSTFEIPHVDSDNNVDDIAQNSESHANRHLALQNQLTNLARDLAVKEQLASNLAMNSKAILLEDINCMQESEAKIVALEKEKNELLAQLKSVQSTNNNKLAEQRRQKLQELESHITDLRKKVKEQARLIKLREKDELKIKQLNQEILSMKQLKVKLVKEMRAESDKFRQWRVQREKELSKLQDQGRKRENKMKKMEFMHAKQQTVLKRKVSFHEPQ